MTTYLAYIGYLRRNHRFRLVTDEFCTNLVEACL